jgi:hypothetical protein
MMLRNVFKGRPVGTAPIVALRDINKGSASADQHLSAKLFWQSFFSPSLATSNDSRQLMRVQKKMGEGAFLTIGRNMLEESR